jgi:hypothetical protein
MPVVTRSKLKRELYEHSLSVKSNLNGVVNGSGWFRAVVPRLDEVTYAPYSIPGWRQKIKRNQDVTTTLLGVKASYALHRSSPVKARRLTRYLPLTSGLYLDAVAFGSIWSMGNFLLPTSAPATQPLALALASEKFLADYYEKTRSIRGTSTIAEAASAVRGLASPGKALRKEVDNLYQTVRKRMYRDGRAGAKAARRVVSETWLEWNFGIKPLVDDVNGAAQAINRMRDGDFRSSVPIRGVGVSQNVYDRGVYGVAATSTFGGGSYGFGTAEQNVIDQTLCIMRGSVIVSPHGEIPPMMQWGLTAEDLGPGIWEGIPWSWFVDYFTNMSSVIESWSFQSSRLSWANRTVRNSRTNFVSDVTALPSSSETQYFVSGGHSIASYTSVQRYPISWADAAPPLRLRLPGVGSTKWLNLAALSAMYRGAMEERKFFSARTRGGTMKRPRW